MNITTSFQLEVRRTRELIALAPTRENVSFCFLPVRQSLCRLRLGQESRTQTRISFQRPRRNTSRLITARVENAMVIARNTPLGPKPAGLASRYASGISQSQKQNRLIIVGVNVSPAPLNACVSTMPYA